MAGTPPGSFQVTFSSFAALIAPASERATTPTKSFCTTTLTRSGIFVLNPLTLTSFALIPGGRTTRPCSIPGTFRFWMYSSSDRTFCGTSTCLTDWPTTFSSAGFFSGARPVERRLKRWPPISSAYVARFVESVELTTAPFARHEAARGDAELLGGQVDQGLARLGARAAEAAGEVRLHRLAARRRALVGRQPRVRLDQVDHAQRHVELVGGDLHLGRPQARAELDLAGVDRDAAVLADDDPRVDQVLVDEGRADRTGRRSRTSGAERERRAERDDERTAALEEVAAGMGCLDQIRHLSPYAVACEARLTALTMR